MDNNQDKAANYLSRPFTRRQAIKAGGIAAVGLAFSKPLIETIYPKPAFANYVSIKPGCSPGFWKNDADKWGAKQWLPTGYSPIDVFDTVFGVTYLGSATLLTSLQGDSSGGTQLSRHATSALLSATHPDIAFSHTEAQVIGLVQDAVNSGQQSDINKVVALIPVPHDCLQHIAPKS